MRKFPLHEPYLQHRLKQFVLMEIKKFKEGRVPLKGFIPT
jgi:hypothetical protein